MSTADDAFAKALDLDERAAHARDMTERLAFATRALVHAQLAGVAQQAERWGDLDRRRDEQQAEAEQPVRPMSHPGMVPLGAFPGEVPALHPGHAEPYEQAPRFGDYLTEAARYVERTLITDREGAPWRLIDGEWCREEDGDDLRMYTGDLLPEFGPCRVVWVPA